jgi:hypothetical protein
MLYYNWQSTQGIYYLFTSRESALVFSPFWVLIYKPQLPGGVKE